MIIISANLLLSGQGLFLWIARSLEALSTSNIPIKEKKVRSLLMRGLINDSHTIVNIWCQLCRQLRFLTEEWNNKGKKTKKTGTELVKASMMKKRSMCWCLHFTYGYITRFYLIVFKDCLERLCVRPHIQNMEIHCLNWCTWEHVSCYMKYGLMIHIILIHFFPTIIF